MSALRIELFFDQEAGNWCYRVPALHINGGGTPTRADHARPGFGAYRDEGRAGRLGNCAGA
jgi:hypothetical protein